MFLKSLCSLIFLFGIVSFTATAEVRKITLKAVVEGRLADDLELFVKGSKGGMEAIDFRPKALSPSLEVQLTNNVLRLYTSEVIDPENPNANLGARLVISNSFSAATVVLFPLNGKDEGRFKAIAIDNTPSKFKFGESRFVNATSNPMGLAIGEHKLGVRPWKVQEIPAVQKKDDFNMAQVDFHFQEVSTERWTPFSERRLKFVESQKRIFVASYTKGASMPSISTIVELKPLKIPEEN